MTERIITDSNGRKHITNEPLLHKPAQDNTYGYAKYLAEAMFKRHFASDEHYASGRVVWGVNDTVIGILTQIDNMVADMVRRPAQQEPVAWADECRISLVTAIHFLASDYENALGVFRDDTEARRKAEGDIAYARKIAAKWNWNGTSPPAQRTWVNATTWRGLTDEQYFEIGQRHWLPSIKVEKIHKEIIEAANGIKGDA